METGEKQHKANNKGLLPGYTLVYTAIPAGLLNISWECKVAENLLFFLMSNKTNAPIKHSLAGT
jgi:hypothetical protein